MTLPWRHSCWRAQRCMCMCMCLAVACTAAGAVLASQQPACAVAVRSWCCCFTLHGHCNAPPGAFVAVAARVRTACILASRAGTVAIRLQGSTHTTEQNTSGHCEGAAPAASLAAAAGSRAARVCQLGGGSRVDVDLLRAAMGTFSCCRPRPAQRPTLFTTRFPSHL